MVRAPIVAPIRSPKTHRWSPWESTVASAATDASAGQRRGRLSGDKTCAARANVRYGDVRRTRARASIASPSMLTRWPCGGQLEAIGIGEKREVAGPASIFATRRIRWRIPRPGHFQARASSRCVTVSRRISGFPAYGAACARRTAQSWHVKAKRDVGIMGGGIG